MIAPAFWCTTLIANYALAKFEVPRRIIPISTSCLNLSAASEEELGTIASPRATKDGKILYLSNGIVSWINCKDLDHEDLEMEWDDEIEMLERHGLMFGRDMVRVQWDWSRIFTTDNKQLLVDCGWVKLMDAVRIPWQNKISDTIGGPPERALLWVDERKMFKGYDIRKIST